MVNIKSCEQVLDLLLEFAEEFQILGQRYDIPDELVNASRGTCIGIMLAYYSAYKDELEFADIIKCTIPTCFYAGLVSSSLWNEKGSDILSPNLYVYLTTNHDITKLDC